MAFELTPSQQENQKFRIGLSEFALEVIRHDIAVFGNGCDRGSYINDILENYMPKAQSSISRVLASEYDGIEDCLSAMQNASDIRMSLYNRRARQLHERMPKYDVSETKIHRLRNEIVTELTAHHCTEDQYYGKKNATGYIKAVIEEYVRLPYVEREIIYFNKKVQVIEEAVDKCILDVSAVSGESYALIPHSIKQDAMYTANYLVCYSQQYDDFNTRGGNMRPACFRISRLRSVLPTEHEAKLTSEQKQILQDKIKNRGVEFLSYQETNVVVRLSKEGQKKYRELRHLRPRSIRVDGDIYTFNCTVNQAEFYFFKFGQDAEILKPPELRKRFANMYHNAHAVYNDSLRGSARL